MKLLFINHRKSQCGVYEFGRNIGAALENSALDFSYSECDSNDELQAALRQTKPDLIVYNHHPATMTWLNSGITKKIKVPQAGIIHEVTQPVADRADNSLFNFYIAHDPTLQLKNPLVFKAGRLIPQYENRFELPATPIIGSFGFAGKKGHKTIIELVQKEFDAAVIRLNIPFAAFGDKHGEMAKAIADDCRSVLRKPGVELVITHDFLEEPELLDFLAKNTINAFLYEPMTEQRGISGATDLALAVKRPIAITRQTMFRHIYNTKPSICVEDNSLKTIIENGVKPLERFYEEWSADRLCADYERICRDILAVKSIPQIVAPNFVQKGFQKVLRKINGLAAARS